MEGEDPEPMAPVVVRVVGDTQPSALAIDQLVLADEAVTEASGGREDLERRARLVGMVDGLVLGRQLDQGVVSDVRVEGGIRGQRHDRAGSRVHDHRAAAVGFPFLDDSLERRLGGRLDHRIDGQRNIVARGRVLADEPIGIDGVVTAVFEGQPATGLATNKLVELVLDTRLPVVFVAHESQDVSRELAVGVIAFARRVHPDGAVQLVLLDCPANRVGDVGRGLLPQVPELDVFADDPLHVLDRHPQCRGKHQGSLVAVPEEVGVYVNRLLVDAAGKKTPGAVVDVAANRRDVDEVLLLLACPLDKLVVEHYLKMNEPAGEDAGPETGAQQN